MKKTVEIKNKIMKTRGWKAKFLLMLLSFVFIQSTLAQVLVTGKITDENGESVIGASILIKGTTVGTITDIDGNFTLAASEGDVIVCSFVGYLSQEIAVSSETATLDLILLPDLIGIEEIVVTAYGTATKATLTGSVATVAGEDIVESPVLNISNTLAGRIQGLITVSRTGEPGYDESDIYIRGVNTFGNASPLIVVDGVPGRSMSRLDPNTIESISVLKDASAAIYGAQAANGVILITTKRGVTGKPKVNFSYNLGFLRPTIIPEMCDAAEYATLLNEIDTYAGNPERYTADDIQKFRDGSSPWTHPNTDWFKETLKPWSQQHIGNLSLSGGTERINYYVSVSARTQDGMYYNSGTRYNQYDFRTNLDGKISNNIKLGINVSGRLEDRNYPTRSAQSIFRAVMRGKPHMPAYWPTGEPGPDIEYGDNPVVVSTKATGYDHDKDYVLNSNFILDVNIPWIKGLSLKGNAAIDKTLGYRKIWQTPWYLYSWDGVSTNPYGDPLLVKGQKGYSEPRLTQYSNDGTDILLNGLLKFERDFLSDHTVNFLAGAERITGQWDQYEAYRRYYISPEIDQLFAGGQDELNNSGSASATARLNYFGRMNYDFRNKYFIEFVWRYQGSFIFEKSSRYGFFPGVSLGYLISAEDFWQENLGFINFFKIRGSWGKTGNDLIAPFQYMSTYSFNNYWLASYWMWESLLFIDNGGTGFNLGLQANTIPNRNVTWETAVQRNIGFDADFLEGRFSLTADYFSNLRTDILWRRNATVPASAGMILPDENIGEVENKGFDFNLEYKSTAGNISYQVGLNGGYAKNKILFWDEPPGAPEWQQSTGRPINSGLYYQAIGIFADQAAVDAYPHWAGARQGDIIFEDYNNDGVIDADDRVRHDKSNVPTFSGGLSASLQYKGFDLSLLFQGAAGATRYVNTESGDIGNFRKVFYDNRWTEDNPNADWPRTYNRGNEYWRSQGNTFWLYNTDYIRLKNLEIGYSLPATMLGKAGIQKLRFYLSGFNLLTFMRELKDFDPEIIRSDGREYPNQKIINFGVNATF